MWLPLALGGRSGFFSSWQNAREVSDRGLALAPRSPAVLPSQIRLEYQVGDFEQGEMYLDRLIDVARAADPGYTAPMMLARLIPVYLGFSTLHRNSSLRFWPD